MEGIGDVILDLEDWMGDRMYELWWENLGNWLFDSKDGRRLEILIFKF